MSFITLTHPTAGAGGSPQVLSLPGSLLWVDQYGWQQVAMSKEYTTTGALVLESWARQAGRPMTLQGTQDRAWCARGDLETLRAWAGQPGLVLSINHRGETHSVAFDGEQSPIEAEPLSDLLQGGQSRYTVRNAAGDVVTDVDLDYFNPRPTDPFSVTLRFVIL
jgi:hypothetical protein